MNTCLNLENAILALEIKKPDIELSFMNNSDLNKKSSLNMFLELIIYIQNFAPSTLLSSLTLLIVLLS